MKNWWEGYPWRMIQTNLREIDMTDIDKERYVASLQEMQATVVLINTAGMAPPTSPPLLSPIKKAMAGRGSRPKVKGIAIAMAITGPMPGTAPTN